jgi:hypothetical protein
MKKKKQAKKPIRTKKKPVQAKKKQIRTKQAKTKKSNKKSNKPILNCLLAYYSLSGNTRSVAIQIADYFGEVPDQLYSDEITTSSKYDGKWGYLKAALSAMFKKTPEIIHRKSPGEYDLVILATPIWVGNFSSPVRSYIEKNKEELLKTNVAVISMRGGSEALKIYEELYTLGIKPFSSLDIVESEIEGEYLNQKINDFCIALIEKVNLKKEEQKKQQTTLPEVPKTNSQVLPTSNLVPVNSASKEVIKK